MVLTELIYVNTVSIGGGGFQKYHYKPDLS